MSRIISREIQRRQCDIVSHRSLVDNRKIVKIVDYLNHYWIKSLIEQKEMRIIQGYMDKVYVVLVDRRGR